MKEKPPIVPDEVEKQLLELFAKFKDADTHTIEKKYDFWAYATRLLMKVLPDLRESYADYLLSLPYKVEIASVSDGKIDIRHHIAENNPLKSGLAKTESANLGFENPEYESIMQSVGSIPVPFIEELAGFFDQLDGSEDGVISIEKAEMNLHKLMEKKPSALHAKFVQFIKKRMERLDQESMNLPQTREGISRRTKLGYRKRVLIGLCKSIGIPAENLGFNYLALSPPAFIELVQRGEIIKEDYLEITLKKQTKMTIKFLAIHETEGIRSVYSDQGSIDLKDIQTIKQIY